MGMVPSSGSFPPDWPAEAIALAPILDEEAAAVDGGNRRPAFPHASLAALSSAGLLLAALPRTLGGAGLAGDPVSIHRLRDVLVSIGSSSLTVGRLFEGHVNAIHLAEVYRAPDALQILAGEVRAGRISGVWNAERGTGLAARRVAGGWRLDGRKIHCSGAGSIRRPLVTAAVRQASPDTAPLMVLADMTGPGISVDLSVWRAAGMRGTATGTVIFEDVFVPEAAVIGMPGDYYRAPWFSGGAWRVLAVQLGGLERALKLHIGHLRASGRDRDPLFRARLGSVGGWTELARLGVEAAARAVADATAAPDRANAYLDQMRAAFERLAMDIVAATRLNVGLQSFIAPDPLDRVLRDLETYLRQPFVDASRDRAAAWLLRDPVRD